MNKHTSFVLKCFLEKIDLGISVALVFRMETPKPKPSVMDYTDYRRYLADRFEWEKTQGFYSHKTFADRAGLKSRSYLRLIIVGKRNLTPDSIVKFSSALSLLPVESEAFTALVHFNQATNHVSRKHYWEIFSQAKPKEYKPQKIHDLYAYLTRTMYPILLILLRQEHISHDVGTLAQLTGLSQEEVHEALHTFTNMGVLSQFAGGKYQVTSPTFETGNDIMNMAIPIFHQNMLKLAQKKTELPQGEREFQCVMMPLDQKEFLYMKKRLRDLADEFDEMFGTGSRNHTDCTYALNMNLVPVTKTFIRSELELGSSQKLGQTTDLKEVVL